MPPIDLSNPGSKKQPQVKQVNYDNLLYSAKSSDENEPLQNEDDLAGTLSRHKNDEELNTEFNTARP